MKRISDIYYILFLICWLFSSCSQLKESFTSGKDDLPIEEYADNTNFFGKEKKKKTRRSKIKKIKEPKTSTYSNNQHDLVINEATRFLNAPYSWGGTSLSGVDCSGLVLKAYQAIDMQIPRVSNEQANYGEKVRRENIQKGDVLFFSAGRAGVIGHSALVVEVNGDSVKFIHATSGNGVRYDYLESEHWNKLFISARRYIN